MPLKKPITSRNPERALMFWDIATSDEDLWRAIYYGIEEARQDIQNQLDAS
jgi:hypothetical protein